MCIGIGIGVERGAVFVVDDDGDDGDAADRDCSRGEERVGIGNGLIFEREPLGRAPEPAFVPAVDTITDPDPAPDAERDKDAPGPILVSDSKSG